MLRHLFICSLTVLASATAVARTVSSPRSVETGGAVYYELRDGGAPVVIKTWRTRSTVSTQPYGERKSIVTVTLATGDDRVPANEVLPAWAGLNTVAGEITTTSGCEFRSRVVDQVTGVQGHGGKPGLTFGGSSATICTFTMFVLNSKLDGVLETLRGEERPIEVGFEPLTVRTVQDVEVKVPLADWYDSMTRYAEASNDFGPPEAVFALGFTAAKFNAVSDRMTDLGAEGLAAMLAYVRPRFFDASGERWHVRQQNSAPGEYRYVKTIVTGEKTYAF